MTAKTNTHTVACPSTAAANQTAAAAVVAKPEAVSSTQPTAGVPPISKTAAAAGLKPRSDSASTMPPPPPGYPVPAKANNLTTQAAAAVPSTTASRPAVGIRPVPVSSASVNAHLPPNTAKRPITTIASRPIAAPAPRPQPSLPTSAPPPSPPPPSHPANTATTKYVYEPKTKRPILLRRGKWTTEEEAYATRLIQHFKAGLLPLTDGTTLRNFLSKLLNCDPMRISKKFVGNNCIGKQVFRRRGVEMGRLGEGEMRRTSMELSDLEQRFFDRVASTNRVRPTTHPPQMSFHSPHMRRNYIEDDRDRPPTPPWLKPPGKYVTKRKYPARKKLRVAIPSVNYQQQPVQSVTQPVATTTAVRTAPTVTITKPDTEKVMTSILKSNSKTEQPIKKSESALEQLARTASAAKFVEDIVNGDSGLGDVEIKGAKLSSLSLQGSFQALMSLDLESVESLMHLSSTKNLSSDELNKLAEDQKKGSGSKSSNRIESFIKSLSHANLDDSTGAELTKFLSNLQKNSLHDFGDEKFNRADSSTGLSKLRAHNGLNSSLHDSIEDFLSLMNSGDIPHEDIKMLSVPLQKAVGSGTLSSKLSQHQLLKLASRASLAKLASKTNLSESLSDLAAACSSASNVSVKKRKHGDAT